MRWKYVWYVGTIWTLWIFHARLETTLINNIKYWTGFDLRCDIINVYTRVCTHVNITCARTQVNNFRGSGYRYFETFGIVCLPINLSAIQLSQIPWKVNRYVPIPQIPSVLVYNWKRLVRLFVLILNESNRDVIRFENQNEFHLTWNVIYVFVLDFVKKKNDLFFYF